MSVNSSEVPFTYFTGIQRDGLLSSEGRIVNYQKHEKKHASYPPDFDKLLIAKEPVATMDLRSCKGIFIIFPDGNKGVIHFFPKPDFVYLNERIKKDYPNLSFRGATSVVVSSDQSYTSADEKELGIDRFFTDFKNEFPELTVNKHLFFAHPFIEECTIELGKEGLSIFDHSRLIDVRGNEWYSDKGVLKPLQEGVDQVSAGINELNQKLKNLKLLV